jgi:hypothetical protein
MIGPNEFMARDVSGQNNQPSPGSYGASPTLSAR